MRWLALLILMASCTPTWAKRTVLLPNTPEANACQRECMMVSNLCGYAESCHEQKQRCLETCPGAVVADRVRYATTGEIVPPPAD